MTDLENYQYNVIPFGWKNVGMTCPRMVNKIFQEVIWETLKVYMNDMIVKFDQEELHTQHLQQMSKSV